MKGKLKRQREKRQTVFNHSLTNERKTEETKRKETNCLQRSNVPTAEFSNLKTKDSGMLS